MDGLLPSSSGAYKYAGWAEDHPLYQQVASEDPFKLFYWHSRSGKPGASVQGEWVLSKTHRGVFAHDPCTHKGECFEGKASDSRVGFLDSLRKAQWERANVKGISATPAAINRWPDFSTFVLCSTADRHICGVWKQAKKEDLAWRDLFDRSQTSDSWYHARPVFEPETLFSDKAGTTDLRDSQQLSLKYTKGRWCILKQDTTKLCKAPSDEPLPFRKTTIQANFSNLEGWQSCDSSGNCLMSSDMRVGTMCHPLCRGCFGPEASHCLHCQKVNSSSGVCASQCKEGQEIEVDGTCKSSCSSVTCGKDQVYKENFDKIIGKTTQKCCVDACSSVKCKADYTHIEEADKTAIAKTTSCCVKACSAYTCPEQHIHKQGASTTAGETTDQCCDKTCSAYTCPEQHIHKQGASTTVGETTDQCCDKTCSAYTCPEQHIHKQGASTTAGETTDQCCDKTCSAYTCPEQHIHKQGSSTTLGQTTDQCCDKTCSAYKCPEQHIHKQGSSTTAGQTTDQCCDKTCSSYKCPEQHIHKQGSSTTAGQTTDQCCDKTCSAYACPEQHIHKQGSSTIAGQTTDQCCDKTCSAYKCPEQHIHKQGSSTTAGQTTEVCCRLQDSGL